MKFYREKTDIKEIIRTLAQIPKYGSIRATAKATYNKRKKISRWIRELEPMKKEINKIFKQEYRLTEWDILKIWPIPEPQKETKKDKEKEEKERIEFERDLAKAINLYTQQQQQQPQRRGRVI